MFFLHHLHTMYFDAVQLAELLDHIPDDCAFWKKGPDQTMHCTNLKQEPTIGEFPLCMWSLGQLTTVREQMNALNDSLEREIDQLHPEDVSRGLESQVFRLRRILIRMRRAMDDVRDCLAGLYGKCGEQERNKLTEATRNFRRSISDMESILEISQSRKASIVA
ncbi:MAG: hypothetical protein HY774_02105 [Acidobacteria bacterium]|nr:hypothetical protein [Acidobacteriota bacterium]